MASKNLKGITLDIGGNTQPLQKALGEVDAQSRKLQGELKEVERLLKLDPTNTTLIAQKQELLSKSIETTKQRLDALRTSQDQVNQQFANGEIAEEQYRAFQREIVQTEQKLRGLENQIKGTNQESNKLDTNTSQAGKQLNTFGNQTNQASNDVKKLNVDLKKVSEGFKDVGEGVSDAGEKITKGVSAPLLALGAVGAKGVQDVNASVGELRAQLGLTSEEARELQMKADKAWENGFGENLDEATRAVILVKQNLKEVPFDQIDEAAESALFLSQTFDEDLNSVTGTASVMMKNFGISSQDAFDLMTTGFQGGANFSGELLDTLREYSPQFKSLGLTADQFMKILIDGAQAGAFNLDKVGDAMKEFNIRAQDGSTTTQEGFAMIGLNANQMGAAIAKGGDDAQNAFKATVTALASIQDPLKQNQAGVNLFGTQWEDLRGKVITAMSEGTKGLQNFQGATKNASNAIIEENPMEKLEIATRKLRDALSTALTPIINDLSDKIIPKLTQAMEKFSSYDPAIQKVIIAFGGVAIAIGPVLAVIGKLIKAFGIIGELFVEGGALAGVFGEGGILAGIGATLGGLAVPIEIVIGAIVAIGLVLKKLYDDNQEFRDMINEAWNTIKTTINNVVQAVKDFVMQTFGDLLTWWNDNQEQIKEGCRIAWEKIQEVIMPIIKVIADSVEVVWGNLKVVIEIIWDSIKEAIKIAIEAVKTVIMVVMDILRGDWEGAWNALKEGAINIFNIFTDGIKNKFNIMLDWFKGMPDKLWKIGEDVIDGLINGIQSKFETIKNVIKGIGSLIPNGIKKLLDIHSPSRVMMELGVFAGQGFENGLAEMQNKVAKQANQMALNAQPRIDMNQVITANKSNGLTGNTTNNYIVQANQVPSYYETMKAMKFATR